MTTLPHNNKIPRRRCAFFRRSQKSLGPLRMAEEDAMEAAQATAKSLNDQAAALREGMPPLVVTSFISCARPFPFEIRPLGEAWSESLRDGRDRGRSSSASL